MRNLKQTVQKTGNLGISALAALVLAGCQSPHETAPASQTPAAPAPAAISASPAAMPAAAAPAAAPANTRNIIRIKAGSTEPVKDSEGNTWMADQGFTDGDTAPRTDIKIENTKNPMLYMSERYGMTAFSCTVPNGKYVVKLHFAETYDGITGAGQRVFSVNVQGHEIKDLDVWAKAGGPLRPDIETVPIEVKDSKVQITFAGSVQNPEINAIEIDPQP